MGIIRFVSIKLHLVASYSGSLLGERLELRLWHAYMLLSVGVWLLMTLWFLSPQAKFF